LEFPGIRATGRVLTQGRLGRGGPFECAPAGLRAFLGVQVDSPPYKLRARSCFPLSGPKQALPAPFEQWWQRRAAPVPAALLRCREAAPGPPSTLGLRDCVPCRSQVPRIPRYATPGHALTPAAAANAVQCTLLWGSGRGNLTVAHTCLQYASASCGSIRSSSDAQVSHRDW
jgi:hypothetical protein